MDTKRFLIGNIALLSGLLAVGCQGSTKPDPLPAPESPGRALVAGAERDLQVLSAHVVAAFREVNGTYRAGHLTHDVHVADGFIEVTPYHVDDSNTRIVGGAMALRTGSIRMDDGTSFEGDRASRLENGVVEVQHGEVIETITNREDGVEQAWRFDAAPQATGDLTVTVAVAGQEFVADTATGLHFRSSKGLGFRYSDAVWVESNGTRWDIEARHIDGQIVMTVPSDIVANTTFPAILDPTVTPEIAVDAPVNGGTGATATNAAIAFDGTNYLVVWADRRLSVDADIFGARITPTGTILDANGIAISTTPGVQSSPAVTFAGGTFVVAWEDFKVTGGTEADIDAARVSSAGVATQLGAIAATAASETDPALGSAGATGLLAWTSGAADITGAVFNGTTFGAPVAIAASANQEIDPAVAGNPAGDFLVAWSEGAAAEDLRGQLVTTAGTPNGVAFDISAGAGRQFDPSATFDGTNYMLAWTVNNNGINIFGTRVSPTGEVLNTHLEGTLAVGGTAVTLAANTQDQPSIACTTIGCAVVWREQRNVAATSFDIFAQRVSSDFTLNGGEIIVANVGQPQQAPSVGTDGTNFFGVWHDLRDVQITTVFGSTISNADGSVGPATQLVTGNNREINPAVGRAAGTHVVAWTDSRSGSSNIEFVRFTGNTKLDATSRSASNAVFAQFSPSVSSSLNGTSSYVVWSDTRGGATADIFGTKVNNDGTVTNAAGIAINQAAGDQLVPTVSANSTSTAALVVWQDRRNNNFDIMGALLDAGGNVVQSDIVICNAAGDQTRPTATFDTTNQQWVVVWSDGRDATDTDIFATRVSSAGAVLDPNGIEISSAAGGSQFAPVIAFTSNVFLAVWQDRRNDPNGDIFGTRLTAGGSLQILDANSVSFGGTAGAQTAPAVAQNIGSFVVAWQDTRNAATTGSDIFAVGVSTSGIVSEPEFVVSAGAGDESTPVLGDSSSAKVSRIAYAKVNATLRTVRVATRQITIGSGTGNSCSTNAQCGLGGFCRDFKCCDNDCGGVGNKSDCLACSAELSNGPDGVCSTVRAGKLCRGYADTFCDREEKCDGVNTTCPEDIGRFQGQTCTISGGGSGTCPLNTAAGAPHVCQ